MLKQSEFLQEMARLDEKSGKKGRKRDHLEDDTEESMGVRNRIMKNKKKFKKWSSQE